MLGEWYNSVVLMNTTSAVAGLTTTVVLVACMCNATLLDGPAVTVTIEAFGANKLTFSARKVVRVAVFSIGAIHVTVLATSVFIVTISADWESRYKDLASNAERVTLGAKGAKILMSAAVGLDIARRMGAGALT